MLIKYSKEVEQEYRNHPGKNQSDFKKLLGGVYQYKKLKKEEEERKDLGIIPESFLFGGYLDTLMTGTDEDIEKIYFPVSAEVPSDKIEEIINEILEKIDLKKHKTLDNAKEDIIKLESFKAYYGKSRTEDWKFNKIKKFEPFIIEKVKGEGKILISNELVEEAKEMKLALLREERTRKYFVEPTEENILLFHQVPIYFDLEISGKVISCKVLLDIVEVEVDENGNAVRIQPVDLKSTFESLLNVPNVINRYRYDIQAAFYTESFFGINKILPEEFPKITKETEVMPFKFIFCSRAEPSFPLSVTLANDLIYRGVGGSRINPYYNKGFYQLLDEMSYYEEHGWDTERIFKEANHEILIGEDTKL